MSFALENQDAWVLSPYCFCKDRPWLSVDDVHYIDAKDGEGGGVGIATIPGLSGDETALLAALLTALAIFLFLLFLLLCLLCPFGLCCGKKGFCCSKASRSNKSSKAAGKAGSDSSSISLTAVNMKIPRPWTDGGVSDSEVEKNRKFGTWGSGKTDHWWGGLGGKGGYNNDGFDGDYFRNGGWFSTADLDSVYGGRSLRGRKGGWDGGSRTGGEMVAMDEFYRGNAKDNTDSPSMKRYRRSSYSDIIEKLMTPHYTTDLSTTSNGGNNNYYATVTSTGKGRGGDVVEAVTVTRQETTRSMAVPISGNNMNAMNVSSEITSNNARLQAGNQSAAISYYDKPSYSVTAPPYSESQMSSTTVSSMAGGYGDAMRDGEVRRQTIVCPESNVVTEIHSAYRRKVTEETETTTD